MMNLCSDEEYFYRIENMVIRSTKYLHQLFKMRWKVESGEDWMDEPFYIQDFLIQQCENMLKKATPLQKKIVFESSTTNDWDISLISLILLNFGDVKKYKLQNQAVHQLRNLRNDLAHHKSKKFTQIEYCEIVKTFKKTLQILKISKSEIELLTEESNLSSSYKTIERMKVLIQKADQFNKLQDFDSALEQYSEAITIPRLLPNNLGEVYEKRAACYLSILNVKVTETKHSDQAILDVEQALQLNKSSWNAHYLKAQCYKAKNNLSEAIRHYEMALALSPLQKQVKQDLASCKLLSLTHITNANLNINQFPMNKSELVRQHEFLNRFGMQNVPVLMSEQYYHGLEVRQDYEKAVMYLAHADKQGSALACFNLAYCYFRGHGVQSDAGKAVEILKRCANMDPKIKRNFETYSPLGFNCAVASAEKFIGKCYEEGTGVDKNIHEAASWYLKGMEHGHGEAATHLGLLYFYGNGPTKDDKMAEMCFKQGLILNCVLAGELLVEHYRRQLEPDLAWTMFKITQEMGHSRFLEMSDEQFNRDLTLIQSERCRLENLVKRFEKQFNPDFKGMTFRQRVTRAEQGLYPNSAKFNISVTCTNKSWAGKIQNLDKDILMAITNKSQSGSETAARVLKTLAIVLNLNDLLAIKDDSSRALKLKIVNLFYECTLLEDHFKMFILQVDKFQRIVADLFSKTCEQKGDEDMKIRLCYVGQNLWSSLKSPEDLYAFGILKEGLSRYPDNYGYYRLIILCLIQRKSFKSALHYVNEALKRFPERVDPFYYKASVLLNTGSDGFSKAIAAFKVFLDMAPRDHRMVPEAYYNISVLYIMNYMNYHQGIDPECMDEVTLILVRRNFEYGKDAEKDQLPCYHPYGETDCQMMVTGFLGKVDENSKLECNSKENMNAKSLKQLTSVLERKVYIKSPVRKGLILQHRERHREADKVKVLRVDDKLVSGKFQQARARQMANLKSIALQEMNPTKDNIFENKIIELTIIDEPNICSNSIQLVAEDDNGDTTRVLIDNNGSGKHFWQKFEAGCRLAIINPYMWVCSKSRINGIRINEPKCILFLENVKNVCRFCGVENATRKCSKCKRLYCSRECQKLDWEIFDHKLICSVHKQTFF